MKSPILLLPLAAISLWGQAAPSVPASWDVSKSVRELAAQVAKLKPVLAQLTPRDWVASKDAPEAYVAQWQGVQQELDYLAQSAGTLEQQPERLSAALDLYFRLQTVEWRLQSLAEGAQKYQSPEAGDLISEAVGADATQRDQLRQYITELAAQNEQEFSVVEREAQRCREDQNRSARPPAPAPAKRNTKAK